MSCPPFYPSRRYLPFVLWQGLIDLTTTTTTATAVPAELFAAAAAACAVSFLDASKDGNELMLESNDVRSPQSTASASPFIIIIKYLFDLTSISPPSAFPGWCGCGGQREHLHVEDSRGRADRKE